MARRSKSSHIFKTKALLKRHCCFRVADYENENRIVGNFEKLR